MSYKGQPAATKTHDAYRSKVSDGKSVEVEVPESTTIENQNFYELGGFFGSATQSVKTESGETDTVVLTIEQAEYETDQIQTSKDFKPGDTVYLKDGKLTTESESGSGDDAKENRLVGRVTQGKDKNNVIWFILAPQV